MCLGRIAVQKHRTSVYVCMGIKCQSMSQRLQSRNNAVNFLLDEAAHRICACRDYTTMTN